ncbi:hypothetical protein Q8W71_20845 [Methylobacterium sp. NEAU 140]|uniref:hypothetical protein n=1 Tax=Methylobacterium sp. NEAU 140 TaxID=3064945 RepID=UPI002734858A|nr:hypothetical protein [Methylobacterium sp. NEAU 140]MDP4025081.1 hypothetical protein [Methylobacterium sp. NEAU 140]
MPDVRAAGPDTAALERASRFDALVLATVNAPFKRAITPEALVTSLRDRRGTWRVHVNAFFNDVRPELVLDFAEAHGVSRASLKTAYQANAAFSGARNPMLEAALAAVDASS